jgi:hypothetical protein
MDSISAEYAVDQAATVSAPSEPVVSVRGLVKRYGSREAIAGIDLEVRRGEIFAFLGPNGAGKPVTGLWHFFRSLHHGDRVRRLTSHEPLRVPGSVVDWWGAGLCGARGWREPEGECRTVRTGPYLDGSAVGLRDVAHDGQSEARARHAPCGG